jgi:hypothetical protein
MVLVAGCGVSHNVTKNFLQELPGSHKTCDAQKERHRKFFMTRSTQPWKTIGIFQIRLFTYFSCDGTHAPRLPISLWSLIKVYAISTICKRALQVNQNSLMSASMGPKVLSLSSSVEGSFLNAPLNEKGS